MAYTDINSEDRLVQKTFASHLESVLGWDSLYAWNQETFGPTGTLGRTSERDAVLVRDLRAALIKPVNTLFEGKHFLRFSIEWRIGGMKTQPTFAYSQFCMYICV
ncbi:hypothetical protein [Propionivibrio sp.]|uniref:hypothetical protein n=1 Tax=Propionivibrio sp. TaxID=2212460 RepID=UPI003BF2D3B4